MNSNQLRVINFLVKNNFYDAIEELNGDFETVPEEVYDAWEQLNELEKLEVVKEAAEYRIALLV